MGASKEAEESFKLIDVSEVNPDEELATRVILMKSELRYAVIVEEVKHPETFTKKYFNSEKEARSYFEYAVESIASDVE